MGNRTRQIAPPGAVLPGVGAVPPVLDYAYDANSNLTAISTGQTFAWDVFNRLTQATGPGGTVSYTYNGDGLKIRRVGPDGTRRYYYDGIKPIWEGNDVGSLLQQYDRDIFGNLLSRRDSAGVRRYYHLDGLGSTTALTTETGAVAATLLYDAWGNERASTGSNQGRYRFTGAERDPTTGLYHMHARFYDPTIGRWLSEDPVQDQYFNPLALNFYTYVWGAPTGFVDHNGLFPVPVHLIIANSVHRAVERWFLATFPGSFTEYRIQGLGLRLDMMKPGPSGGWEVYELKPASVFGNPGKLKAAMNLNPA